MEENFKDKLFVNVFVPVLIQARIRVFIVLFWFAALNPFLRFAKSSYWDQKDEDDNKERTKLSNFLRVSIELISKGALLIFHLIFFLNLNWHAKLGPVADGTDN